jgi:hypothetical protein
MALLSKYTTIPSTVSFFFVFIDFFLLLLLFVEVADIPADVVGKSSTDSAADAISLAVDSGELV